MFFLPIFFVFLSPYFFVSNYIFCMQLWRDTLLLLYCCIAIVHCSCVYFKQFAHFGKQICAVESNVLLNEMFTLFCDQSSNSASRQTIYLRLRPPLIPIPSVQVSFVISPIFMRFTCAYKTQTHLTGIITRHNHMHHAFRCTCLLFLRFFALSISRTFRPTFSLVRVSLSIYTNEKEYPACDCTWIRDGGSLGNKWRRTCLNLPGNTATWSLSIEHTHTQTSKLSMEIWAQTCYIRSSLSTNWKLL